MGSGSLAAIRRRHLFCIASGRAETSLVWDMLLCLSISTCNGPLPAVSSLCLRRLLLLLLTRRSDLHLSVEVYRRLFLWRLVRVKLLRLVVHGQVGLVHEVSLVDPVLEHGRRHEGQPRQAVLVQVALHGQVVVLLV